MSLFHGMSILDYSSIDGYLRLNFKSFKGEGLSQASFALGFSFVFISYLHYAKVCAFIIFSLSMIASWPSAHTFFVGFSTLLDTFQLFFFHNSSIKLNDDLSFYLSLIYLSSTYDLLHFSPSQAYYPVFFSYTLSCIDQHESYIKNKSYLH